MNRSHWENGKRFRDQQREDIPKIRTDCHLDIFGHIGIDLPDLQRDLFKNHEILIQTK